MNGILIIDKPKGYTSFDIIAILRKKFHQKKIGHMGTLDPMATGVLPILFGETAKFQIFSSAHEKKYIAKMHLGIITDSLDITGKVISTTKSNINKNQFEQALKNFKGNISQIPPMFSAIKKNGQKLYELARKGIETKRDARKVEIKEIILLDFDEVNQDAVIEVTCSQGTYIRTLCADIGSFLKVGAVLTELKRTKSNGFNLSQSLSLDDLKNTDEQKILQEYILPTDFLFKDLKEINISPAQANRFKNGGNLSLQRLKLPNEFKNLQKLRLYSEKQFIGLGEINLGSDELKILKCQIN